MQKTKQLTFRSFWIMAICCAIQPLTFAQEFNTGFGFAPTVRDLLLADAEKAKRDAKGQNQPIAPGATTTTPPPEKSKFTKPELIGIYGKKGDFGALVRIENIPVHLKKGERYAGWQLMNISDECISLQKNRSLNNSCLRK